MFLFLCVKAVQFRRFASRHKCPEVNIGRSGIGQGRNADFAKEMNPISGDGNSHRDKIFGAKRGKLMII